MNLAYLASQNTKASVPSITDWYNIGLLLVQTVGAVVAAAFAWVAYRQTQRISSEQIKQTEKIHQEQTTFAQNQAFISLYEYWKDLREIPPEVIDWDDVIKMANLIEVMGVMRAKKVVDEELLFVVYGKLIVKIYEQIQVVRDMNTKEQKGNDILKQAVGAIAIYDRWKKRIEDEKQARLTKGQGKSNVTNP